MTSATDDLLAIGDRIVGWAKDGEQLEAVVVRSRDCARMPTDSVAPGLHAPRAGAHRVVWWDPHALVLDREIGGGIRQQQILAADESMRGDPRIGPVGRDAPRGGQQGAGHGRILGWRTIG